MSSLSAGSATLKRHSAAPGDAGIAIQARLSRTAHSMIVSYALEGDLGGVLIPPPRAPRFADRLWEHTCFELFLRRERCEAYHELNFSPSGEWALYAFERYRRRVAVESLPAMLPIVLDAGPSMLRLEISLPLQDIDGGYAGVPLSVGLSAVIEEADGELSYWALSHPSPKPDFHHPDSFALRL